MYLCMCYESHIILNLKNKFKIKFPTVYLSKKKQNRMKERKYTNILSISCLWYFKNLFKFHVGNHFSKYSLMCV